MKNVKTGHAKPIVCLDAGHYGKYNRSPVVKAYYESDMNWKLHNLLKAELEKYGIEVKVTRTAQAKDLELEARGKASAGCDLFLSIHSNAADAEATNYVVALHMVDDNCGEIDEQSKDFAALLSKTVGSVMGLPYKYWSTKSSKDRDGNGYKDDYYGVLRGAHAVHTAGVIIEHGFHTNTATAKWLLVESNLKKLAEAEAKTIADWFGVEKPVEKFYRVRKSWADAKSQTGAYKNLESAKKACSAGYTVYDWNGKAVYTKPAEPEKIGIQVYALKKGIKGEYVKALQILLIGFGYSCGDSGADGSFGGATKSAVEAFQKANGLKVTGEVDAATWNKLLHMV